MMSSFNKYIIAGILFTLIFSCRKYPENYLWFKRVNKLQFFKQAQISSYKINGVESVQELTKILASKITTKNYQNIFFDEVCTDDQYKHYSTLEYKSDQGFYTNFFYTYSKDKKKISIRTYIGLQDTNIFNKNLFIENFTTWDIIKFKPGGERKLKSKIGQDIIEIVLIPKQ